MSHQPQHGSQHPPAGHFGQPVPAGWQQHQPYPAPFTPPPSGLARAAEEHGPIWRRLLFNALIVAVGAAAVVVAFGLLAPDDFSWALGIWFVIMFFTVPTAALYGAAVEGFGRMIPTHRGRRALAISCAPLGGLMGFIVGIGMMTDGSTQDLFEGLLFLAPIFVVGALWRVPGQRPSDRWLIGLGIAAALCLIGVVAADVLVEDNSTGGFYPG